MRAYLMLLSMLETCWQPQRPCIPGALDTLRPAQADKHSKCADSSLVVL